ncbi:hypothetical protein COLU111180_13985 [Cohnella lubricantis]|uniref:DUF3619 family protein n=1 Tax=Cohnella lubricantis TaxID=2163172 RepID=A0A841TEB3_9BACL|nr:hypothetical protein [Cohnella lubricantis]MBB6676791.1 hypothetical protein [Cohnella lubricantis]MBP2118121.1 hypothetical protein [Cohnella lubricantis]
MRPEEEQQFIRDRLDEELGDLRFLRSAEVLDRTHPRSLPAKLRALWNYEFELPLLPIGASFAVLLAILFVAQLQENTDNRQRAAVMPRAERQLVEAGGNTYWKDEYEKAVRGVEAQDQS